MFVPIMIDNVQYRLRYPSKVQIDVEKTANKFLFGNDGKITLFDLLGYLNLTEVQVYLLWKGLIWEHPDLTFEDVCDLRDKYICSGELDDGEKLSKFNESIAEAVMLSYGMNAKNFMKREKQKAKNGTG